MTLRKIARLGEPVLRQVASPVTRAQLLTDDFQTLIDDMIETMRDVSGAGLAAPQVYSSFRICVIEVNQNPRYRGLINIPLSVFVNPIVTAIDFNARERDYVHMYEGCLSVPKLRGRVQRPRKVDVQSLDRNGEPQRHQFEGPAACVIQHELDHLDGVLFVDRADPRTLTFLPEYERYVSPEARIVDAGA